MLAIWLMVALSGAPSQVGRTAAAPSGIGVPPPPGEGGVVVLPGKGGVVVPPGEGGVVVPPGEGGVVVEQIVAVVRNPSTSPPRPITLTRLVEEARAALVGQGALQAAEAPLDAPALRAALRWLVDQWLVAEEATRLGVEEVSRDELLGALRRFQERFLDDAAYRRFLASADIAEEELAVMLARGLRVERYLESRVGRSARVGDEELARALADRGLTAEAPGARESVRARLRDEKAAAQVRQILSDLRARADVRILAGELAEEAGSTGGQAGAGP